jgi:hypothetical protein
MTPAKFILKTRKLGEISDYRRLVLKAGIFCISVENDWS